ncbi:hypothetical protein MMC18_004195 [Xylographa bjoerkii]|nr:hypothetical protein [Xylographa bjoerkii]
MKFLCLHGKGTSAEIFEMQTGAVFSLHAQFLVAETITEGFRNLLPKHFDYDFLEGEKEVPPAPLIAKVFPGPYMSYLTDYSVSSIEEQHEFIMNIVDEEGPFDGVMGFSQGASLAASILIHHQIEKPWLPPPFRVAVFLCATYAHSRNSLDGKDVTDKVPASGLPDRRRSTDSGYSSDDNSARDSIRVFYADSTKARIQIPTAHLYGENDSYLHESLEIVDLCDQRLSLEFKHKGGHEVPMDAVSNKKIRDIIAMTCERGETFS